MRLIFAVLMGLIVAGLSPTESAFAAGAAVADIYQSHRSEIGEIEDYLNSIKSLKSKFSQSSSNGNAASGTLYLARPNHMRFVYDDPTPIELVADGRNLFYLDTRLKQVSTVSVENSPLAPILKSKASLDDPAIRLIQYQNKFGERSLTFTRADDPSGGEVTLQFSEKPMQLRRWIIRDAQDVTTTVSLLDAENNIDLDPKLFVFHDPRPLNQRIDR